MMPPDFDPIPDGVVGAFDDGFVEVVLRPTNTAQSYSSPLLSCDDANAWAHAFSGYPYPHPPRHHTPHHVGVDRLWSDSPDRVLLGVYCPGDVHSYTAVGTIGTLISRYRDPQVKVRQNTIHEMGHNLGGLEHRDTSHDPNVCAALPEAQRTVMRYSCGTRKWFRWIHYFSVDEIRLLRQRIQSLYE
jgi:hypothetical protein